MTKQRIPPLSPLLNPYLVHKRAKIQIRTSKTNQTSLTNQTEILKPKTDQNNMSTSASAIQADPPRPLAQTHNPVPEVNSGLNGLRWRQERMLRVDSHMDCLPVKYRQFDLIKFKGEMIKLGTKEPTPTQGTYIHVHIPHIHPSLREMAPASYTFDM